RPIFHINEAQTRGHVFVSMFSYAIVKELETVIYPWLKTYNEKNKCKLSYHDITDVLNNIKVGYFGLTMPLISEYGCHSKSSCNIT
ncbi:MAG: hypothetical protein L3J05_00260, partial [Robiginitomaculum sp.]|nr:hypothetical protein [Robiginitomaculum sp.]